jgi:hypothetical protein
MKLAGDTATPCVVVASRSQRQPQILRKLVAHLTVKTTTTLILKPSLTIMKEMSGNKQQAKWKNPKKMGHYVNRYRPTVG